jgi:hypothetical protein
MDTTQLPKIIVKKEELLKDTKPSEPREEPVADIPKKAGTSSVCLS